MIPLVPAPQSAMACGVLLAAGFAGVRLMLPSVARTRIARRSAVALALFTASAHLAWQLGPSYSVRAWGANLAQITLALLPLLIASIPIAATMRRAARAALRVPASPPAAERAMIKRRALLGAATAAAPMLALGGGISGFVQGAQPPRIPLVRLPYPDLPTGLSGLRILQLSDLHLGVDRHVEDLEALLDRLRDERPDLVVLTGDVADDVRELGPALRAVVKLGPRLGVFASLGNHEYLHGVERALGVYREHRDVRLLVGEGERIRVGGAELFVAGADDPVFTHLDPTPFLARSIDHALANGPADTFRLVLSHRPEGFVPAAERDVDLVLSGHTHGGQIGFNGKSAFQPIWHDKYLWGRYSSGRSRLYTTSGFGHWFPFRFLCPAEAPLVVLERA